MTGRSDHAMFGRKDGANMVGPTPMPIPMLYDNQALSKALRAESARLGFAACGVTRADGFDGTRPLAEWLAAGSAGEMTWMVERAEQRARPQGLWPEARSVIALGMSYAPLRDPLALAEAGQVGRFSVYAQGGDYHDTVKKALKALARWLVAAAGGEVKVFVDTAPVMEKPLAALAGLGWQGKHSNLVSREHGSWLFLGAIFTTLELTPDTPAPDRCGSCTACQTACPTQAFPRPYVVDARRCIAYLSIEHKGPIPEEFRQAMGNRVYGCDDCLAVCPWNKFAQATHAQRAFLGRAELAAPELTDLLALDDQGFRQVFAGSPIKRIGRNRLVRNACIAAGNARDRRLVPQLHRLTQDDCAVVADAATWALGQYADLTGENK